MQGLDFAVNRGTDNTLWPKEKVQKDKQLSTKHTHKTKDRLTRTALKPPTAVSTSILRAGYINISCKIPNGKALVHLGLSQ
jgi:hypothetical protein